MSCTNCDNDPVKTFLRVGTGNVMIVGCLEHLGELITNNRAGLKATAKQNNTMGKENAYGQVCTCVNAGQNDGKSTCWVHHDCMRDQDCTHMDGDE